ICEKTELVIVFVQAEDGIRDDLVTGVQTCAVPIYFGMVHDAEMHAAEDKRRKEEVEERNLADSASYRAEKSIAELGDKLTAEQKIGRASCRERGQIKVDDGRCERKKDAERDTGNVG